MLVCPEKEDILFSDYFLVLFREDLKKSEKDHIKK